MNLREELARELFEEHDCEALLEKTSQPGRYSPPTWHEFVLEADAVLEVVEERLRELPAAFALKYVENSNRVFDEPMAVALGESLRELFGAESDVPGKKR